MRFYVRERSQGRINATPPYAVLNRDNWDDYGYKTQFRLEIFLGDNSVVDVGDVKIAFRGMQSGLVDMPESPFGNLPEEYFSLGQEFTYYETLSAISTEVLEEVLEALGDLVIRPSRRALVHNEDAFTVSLTRSQSAERALVDAEIFFARDAPEAEYPGKEELGFTFVTSVGGPRFRSEFTFGDKPHLPNRMFGIIGYNGVGKTRFLANLAMVAQANRDMRARTAFVDRYGQFDGFSPPFGAIIAISYSAFDTFQVPGSNELGETTVYTYCGLRELGTGNGRTLKSIEDVRQGFLSALTEARSDGRRDILSSVLSQLEREPSFASVDLSGFIEPLISAQTGVLDQFDAMSTGHKIVLNIAVQLVANLQLKSLIIIDEPESHLHPPLLAALLRALSVALNERDSYAIVATHSPVVIQEIPSHYVHVLRRLGAKNFVEPPEIETFGENVGQLTSTVFSLDSTATDYHQILRDLAAQFDLEEIEEMFDDNMSPQARAFVVSMKRRGPRS